MLDLQPYALRLITGFASSRPGSGVPADASIRHVSSAQGLALRSAERAQRCRCTAVT